MQAVFRDRNEPTAEASFAAIFERSKLGMAIAAMIKMIATTIRSSISENPFCFLPMTSSPGFILPALTRRAKRHRHQIYIRGSTAVWLAAVVVARILAEGASWRVRCGVAG